MPVQEFQLIEHYFRNGQRQREDVVVGIGDDGAVVRVPAGQELVLVMDTLVSGVHFPINTAAYDIGWKALAVNLSDLAAMGARPNWFTLALTLPDTETAWLEEFSRGLFDLASQYAMQLIGGDTTSGPLSVTVQAHGLVDEGEAMLRSGARPGDRIYVSGTLGDAAVALAGLQSEASVTTALRERLDRPRPRLELGQALIDVASACIDVSDGLLADLVHILESSGVGASVDSTKLPLSDAYREHESDVNLALSGGDDYELLFTADPDQSSRVEAIATQLKTPLTCIGEITRDTTMQCLDAQGTPMALGRLGFEHF
ncbi:MAG: thiamine-phosphate kinase [Gammaproteobacteria bacterium]|nr:thiamine-phosphate kinase [Gammaproteobacteria bacterium]